jgi:peptidylprolyl isomerase
MSKLVYAFLVVILISINGYSQKKTDVLKKTTSGIEYKILTKGIGKKCKKGFRVFINYTTKIKPDTIFDSNLNLGKPFSFILGQEEVLKGWDEGLLLLSVGDSAEFKIPPMLAYGEKKKGSIPANTTLQFNVKVVKLEQAFYDLQKKDTILFKSGLKKIIGSVGKGQKVKVFNNVTIGFTGYFVNSQGYKLIFQSSHANSSFATFQLGIGRMVQGLDEGIATMNVGEKSTFIIKPELGFGKEKNGMIPANTTLYFDVELLSCDNPFYEALNTDTIYTKNGVKVVPVLKQKGNYIKTENVVLFDYTGYFINNQGNPVIFDNTIETKQPILMRPSLKSTNPGLSEGILQLKNGEKAKIIVPSKLAFGEKGAAIIPPNQTLIYDVNILKVQLYPFFETQGLDTVKLESGLYYLQVKKGTGLPCDTGKKVSVSYTGFTVDLLGGREIFDASRESNKLLEFELGKGKVIKGFEEGIMGMQIGEARRLIIPYQLGYGEKGIPEIVIMPKANLYFDVELMQIYNKRK